MHPLGSSDSRPRSSSISWIARSAVIWCGKSLAYDTTSGPRRLGPRNQCPLPWPVGAVATGDVLAGAALLTHSLNSVTPRRPRCHRTDPVDPSCTAPSRPLLEECQPASAGTARIHALEHHAGELDHRGSGCSSGAKLVKKFMPRPWPGAPWTATGTFSCSAAS